MVRRIIGLVLLGLGAWQSYLALKGVFVIVSRGSSISDALLQPPTSLLWTIGALVIFAGGALMVTKKRSGAFASVIGSLILTFSGASFAAASETTFLRADIITAGVAFLLGVMALFLKRA